MKIFNKDYPISIYKHESKQQWIITFDNLLENGELFCFDFETVESYKRSSVHISSLKKRYVKRCFTNIDSRLKRKVAIVLFQMGIQEPLNNLNRR